jgi:hypothetical protein
MKLIDIIIIALVIALVFFTVIYNIRKAKHGGGCSGCDGCSSKTNCGHSKIGIK